MGITRNISYLLELIFISIAWNVVFFILGVLLITWGADKLIDGIGDISRKLKISSIIIAILILGIDLEETVASITAARNGMQEIAIGNVVGNSIISLSFSFALPGLFHSLSFKKVHPLYLWLMLGSSIFLSIGVFIWSSLKINAIIALVLYCIFVVWNFLLLKRIKIDVFSIKEGDTIIDRASGINNGTDEGNPMTVVGTDIKQDDDGDVEVTHFKLIIGVILGFFSLYFGSELLILGTKNILSQTSLMSESFFGIIIIAAATNVEEYTLLFRSIKKRSEEIGLGAMIGKVIWNLGITFGVSALLLEDITAFSPSILYNSLLLCGILCPFFLIIASKKGKIDKSHSILLLLIFSLYLAISILFF